MSISKASLICAFLLAAGSAQAADLSGPQVPIIPPLAVEAPFSWTGVYVGGQLGYDWYKDRTTEYFTATGLPTGIVFNYKPDGISGGAHIGANYQFQSIVLGAVADIEATNVDGGFVDPGIGKGDDEMPWEGSVRAKLGFALDRFLIYGTGGVAFARLKNTYTFIPTGATETFATTKAGWTAGVGINYAFTDNWILGAEYRHTDFGKITNVSTVAFPGLTGDQEPSFDSARASVSYKF